MEDDYGFFGIMFVWTEQCILVHINAHEAKKLHKYTQETLPWPVGSGGVDDFLDVGNSELVTGSADKESKP